MHTSDRGSYTLEYVLAKEQFSYSKAEGEQAWAQELDCCELRASILQGLEGLRRKIFVHRVSEAEGGWVLNYVPKPSTK